MGYAGFSANDISRGLFLSVRPAGGEIVVSGDAEGRNCFMAELNLVSDFLQ